MGFIDRLPHTLVAAFRATLEEVAEADLALHVIDAASPERDHHIAAVRKVLEEVGAADVPILDVYNKVDAITADETAPHCRPRPGSGPDFGAHGRRYRRARTDDGFPARARYAAHYYYLRQRTRRSTVNRFHGLYRVARVVSHVATNGRVVIEADVPRRYIARLTAPETPGDDANAS